MYRVVTISIVLNYKFVLNIMIVFQDMFYCTLGTIFLFLWQLLLAKKNLSNISTNVSAL